MNAKMKLYQTTLNFLKEEWNPEEAWRILGIAQEVEARFERESNQVSVGEMHELWDCVNNSETNNENWLEIKEGFVMAAFKDLSVIKNPEAMELFHEIRRYVLPGDEDGFVWARTIKDRPDGSAVIVLHVSNRDMYEKAMERSRMTRSGDLEEGLLLNH